MIIFIYGADDFRSRRFRQELQEKFKRDIDPGAISLSTIDGRIADLPSIASQLGSGSLFVKKRLVVVENILQNKKEKIFPELASYLQKLAQQAGSAEEDVIIFHDGPIENLKAAPKKFCALLLKQRFVQEFKPLTGSQVITFIKKEAETYGQEIDNNAARELAARTGSDLWQIAQSLRKLCFSTSSKIISLPLVKELVPGIFDENIFALTDALSAKNRQQAIRCLNEQYAAGLSDEYILSMLIRQFKILLQVKVGAASGWGQAEMVSQLKLHPFLIKKGLFQSKNFNESGLKSLLNQLILLDKKNKTGQGDIRTELVLLISRL